MLSIEQKQRLSEIDKEIEILLAEKEQINPYANLKSLANKAFGEGWSEPHILEHCPQLHWERGKGYDFYSNKIGKIEVKSSRLPCKQITFNQLHPSDCDYFLFVLYDTENAEATIYLISSTDIVEKCRYTAQHDRNDIPSCFSMSYKTNQNILENYRIKSWDELRSIV